MAAIGRKPVGEVIVDFLDGGSYRKHKLELHVLSIEERRIRKEQASKQAVGQGAEKLVNQEDVKHLVDEFSLSEIDATKALQAASGNIEEAIRQLIQA